MNAYYSDENNYVELIGVVVSKPSSKDGLLYLEINITTETHDFLLNADGSQLFAFWGSDDAYESIDKDDVINFVSAPMYFYSGHTLPILALEKGDDTLLSLENGKDAYLEWLNDVALQ